MHEFRVKVGPAAFRIGSAWRQPIAQLAALYSDYPTPEIPDFSVRLDAPGLLRRYVRKQVAINGDYMLPDAVPLPFDQALLAAEMGMNLQMALGWRRHLLLHASAVEKDGKPARDEGGNLLFRPAGHGALLENFNRLRADLIYVKNIDTFFFFFHKLVLDHYRQAG
jgi:hypothetical protein